MQSRDRTGAFRNLCAVAAQMHCVAKARFLYGLGDRIAISFLLFRGFRRWQQQVGRTRTSEGFGERRVSLISAVNASAPLSTKRCSRPLSRPMTRTFWPFERRTSATIEPVWPVAPKITYFSFETTDELIVTISLVVLKVR